MGEFDFIEHLKELFPHGMIGDDAAVLPGGLLAAADVLVQGVHFADVDYDAAAVGARAVEVNVSDIAAMGGRPTWLLVTVAAPPAADLHRLYDGIAAGAAAHGCPVVGGDLSEAAALSVSVTVLGAMDEGVAPVLRSGARPGDGIWVSGPLGGAAATGWARVPSARVAEGTAAARAGATAMVDVSDGFGADLGHILDASAVGAAVHDVPLAPGAHDADGGDDYELIATFPADVDPGAPWSRVGEIVTDRSVRPAPAGWVHRL